MAIIVKNTVTLILLDKNGKGLQSKFDVLKCYVLDGLIGGKMVYVEIHRQFGWDGENKKGMRMVGGDTLRFEDGGKYDLVRRSREDVRTEFQKSFYFGEGGEVWAKDEKPKRPRLEDIYSNFSMVADIRKARSKSRELKSRVKQSQSEVKSFIDHSRLLVKQNSPVADGNHVLLSNGESSYLNQVHLDKSETIDIKASVKFKINPKATLESVAGRTKIGGSDTKSVIRSKNKNSKDYSPKRFKAISGERSPPNGLSERPKGLQKIGRKKMYRSNQVVDGPMDSDERTLFGISSSDNNNCVKKMNPHLFEKQSESLGFSALGRASKKMRKLIVVGASELQEDLLQGNADSQNKKPFEKSDPLDGDQGIFDMTKDGIFDINKESVQVDAGKGQVELSKGHPAGDIDQLKVSKMPGSHLTCVTALAKVDLEKNTEFSLKSTTIRVGNDAIGSTTIQGMVSIPQKSKVQTPDTHQVGAPEPNPNLSPKRRVTASKTTAVTRITSTPEKKAKKKSERNIHVNKESQFIAEKMPEALKASLQSKIEEFVGKNPGEEVLGSFSNLQKFIFQEILTGVYVIIEKLNISVDQNLELVFGDCSYAKSLPRLNMLAKMPRLSVGEIRNQENSGEKNQELIRGIIKDYSEQKKDVFSNGKGTDILDKISGWADPNK